VFSIIQRKVIKPADFADLDALRQRLIAFEPRYNATATPSTGASPAPTSTSCCTAYTHQPAEASPLPAWIGQDEPMPTPPASTKTSLTQRLITRARDRWPALRDVQVRFCGQFAYLTGELIDGEVLPLCRLRYAGSANA